MQFTRRMVLDGPPPPLSRAVPTRVLGAWDRPKSKSWHSDSGFARAPDAIAAPASPNIGTTHNVQPCQVNPLYLAIRIRYAAFPEHVQSLAKRLAVWSAIVHNSHTWQQTGIESVTLPLAQDENIHLLSVSIVQFENKFPDLPACFPGAAAGLVGLATLSNVFDACFGSLTEKEVVEPVANIVEHFTKGTTDRVDNCMIPSCVSYVHRTNHWMIDELVWRSPLVIALFATES